ncbi:MAG: DMT family transporter, partial [Bacillota bacterium]|nr:DMT family transporter [Bacillota bacterium]
LDRYSPLRVTALTMSAGTIPMILLSAPVLMAQDWGRVTATSWAALVYSYSVPIVVGYLIWSWGIQRIGSGRTAIYSNLSPLVASLLGWALLGERWSAPQVAGGLLIPLGIAQVRADGRVDRRIDARGQGGVGRWTRVDDRGPETGRRVL